MPPDFLGGKFPIFFQAHSDNVFMLPHGAVQPAGNHLPAHHPQPHVLRLNPAIQVMQILVGQTGNQEFMELVIKLVKLPLVIGVFPTL